MQRLIRNQLFVYPNTTSKLFNFNFSKITRFAHWTAYLPYPKKVIKTPKQLRQEAFQEKVRSTFGDINDIISDAISVPAENNPSGVSLSGEIDPSGVRVSGENPSGTNVSGENPNGFRVSGENPNGFRVSGENSKGFRVSGESEQVFECTPSVCEDAAESVSEEEIVSEETVLSPIVDLVTQIVRRESGSASSMVARLEESGINFSDPEIVGLVLKSCFEVPHLATRFFDTVKRVRDFRHKTETYNTMLYLAGEAREFELVDKLVNEMGISLCKMNVETYAILVSHYGKAEMIGKALAFFEKMVKSGLKPDERLYNSLIQSLCDTGKIDIAMEFYKESAESGVRLRKSLYRALLSGGARSGNSRAVQLVAKDAIGEANVPAEKVYACVLESFCDSGRIREALEFIRDQKDKDFTIGYEHFEILVRGLCRTDRIGDALEIFEILKKRKLMDPNMYGIAVNWYLRKNKVSKALKLFKTMKDSGHCPMENTYKDLMQCLFESNRYKEGCELYSEMLENRIELDIAAMTTVVAGHVRAHQVAEAWQVFRDAEERGIRPTWKAYSVFIEELCKTSSSEEMIKALEEMRASEITIGDDIFHRVTSYMVGKGETDNLERVKQIQKSESKSVDSLRIPKTYDEEGLREICEILLSRRKRRDWSVIQELLEKCRAEITPDLVYEVLKMCVTNESVGLKFFSWIGKRPGYKHSVNAYNQAIKLAGNDFDHMRDLFHEMRSYRYPITPFTWTTMIRQYARVGRSVLALNTFKEMRAENKCDPNAQIYKYLINSLCQREQRRELDAIQLFQEMVKSGFKPDTELLENYLACLCETRTDEAAERCVEAMIKIGYSAASSYSFYVRALCRAGRVDEALALTEEVKIDNREQFDSFTYASIFHGLLRQGRLEEALAKMDSMSNAGVKPTRNVLTSLIVYYLRERGLDKALEILERMKEDGLEPGVVTLSAFIRGYVNVGKVAEAWELFNLMKKEGPVPDFETYSVFIHALCKAWKSEEAIELLKEMSECGFAPSSLNFWTVINALKREGKPSLAHSVMRQKLALVRKRKFTENSPLHRKSEQRWR